MAVYSTKCSYIGTAFMGQSGVVSSELAQQQWRSDAARGSTAVSLLQAPTRPGTVILRAPLPYWDKRLINQAPAAGDFVRHVDIWFSDWVPVLRRGMATDYTGTAPDQNLSRDPAAPE